MSKRKKVWVVTGFDYDATQLDSVWSSEAAATARTAWLWEHQPYPFIRYDWGYEEFILNGEEGYDTHIQGEQEAGEAAELQPSSGGDMPRSE